VSAAEKPRPRRLVVRRPEVETGSREARTDVEVEEAAVLRRERVVGAVAEAIWRCLWSVFECEFCERSWLD
jgi:hypothetical protein